MKLFFIGLVLLQTGALAKWDKDAVSELELALSNCIINGCIQPNFGSVCADCYQACSDENPREKNKVLKGCQKKCVKGICKDTLAKEDRKEVKAAAKECKKSCRLAKKSDNPMAAFAEILGTFLETTTEMAATTEYYNMNEYSYGNDTGSYDDGSYGSDGYGDDYF